MEQNSVRGGSKMASAEKLGIKLRLNKDSVLNHLDFLREVDNEYQLTEGPILNRAIDRYERYWLPLAAKNQQELLAAPLDIEWVWHCHMLSPVAYERGCLHLVQKVVPHRLLNAEDRKIRLRESQKYWEQEYPGMPFNVDMKCQTEEIKEPSVSKIGYDLVQASARQRVFFYHVSLPHYRDVKFLENGLERYKKFLFLLKKNPDCFLAPTYDIDLLWHTHQLDPTGYKTDTMNILGKHLNHDDTVSDRSEDSPLTKANKLIRKLWKEEFNENFVCPGAMYRGESTRGKLHNFTTDEVRNFVIGVSSVQLNITELQLDRFPKRCRIAKLQLGVLKTGLKIPDTEIFHSKKWVDKKRMIWRDSDLYKGRVDTTRQNAVEFGLTGISGYSIMKARVHIGSGKLDCQSLLNRMKDDCISFDESVKLLDSPIQLSVKGTMTNPKPGWVILKVIPGAFVTRKTTPEHRKEIWGPVLIPCSNSLHVGEAKLATCESLNDTANHPHSTKIANRPEVCCVAEHRVAYMTNSKVFTCKVVHSTDVMMSAVYVYHEDDMLACAHLIGSEQLPTSSSVARDKKHSVSSSLTLDPKIGERAMMIQNNTGDWGAVVGRWAGIRKGVPGTKGKYGKRGTPGSYGHLSLSFLKTSTQQIKCSKSSYTSGKLTISILDTVCCEDRVIVKNPQEAAENIALAFSVGILHVLCQPRSVQWKPGFPPNFMLKGSASVPLPPAEEVPFLEAAGAGARCACNRYLMRSRKLDKFHVHSVIKELALKVHDNDGYVGADGLSLGSDFSDVGDDFMASFDMESCDVDCGDIGLGDGCGSDGGGGEVGGGGCGSSCGGGGGSSCGGGEDGSSCGGGGSSCGGGGGCSGGGGSD